MQGFGLGWGYLSDRCTNNASNQILEIKIEQETQKAILIQFYTLSKKYKIKLIWSAEHNKEDRNL